jgi:hypothetical protein
MPRLPYVLSILLIFLFLGSVAAAQPAGAQLDGLAKVTRAERPPAGLTAKQQQQLRALKEAMKRRDVKAARLVWKELRKHPKSQELLDHALFHGFVAREPRLAKAARKYRFYTDQEKQVVSYLRTLRMHSRHLRGGRVRVRLLRWRTSSAEGDVASEAGARELDLSDTIKEVESMQETVRNKRQMASTAFQNFDQKASQLYNLLSSVMKAMNEMRMGTVRNML